MKNKIAQLVAMLIVLTTTLFAQTPRNLGGLISNANVLPTPITIYSQTSFRGAQQQIGAVGQAPINFDVNSVRVPAGYYAELSLIECGIAATRIWRDFAGPNAYPLPASNQPFGLKTCGIVVKRFPNSGASLRIEIATGDDDLRQNSQAVATLTLRNGTSINIPLNNGANWPNGSRNTVNFPLPNGVLPTDIANFAINFTGGKTGPLDSDDNWNMAEIKLSYLTRSNAIFLIGTGIGRPWFRFTTSARRVNLRLQ